MSSSSASSAFAFSAHPPYRSRRETREQIQRQMKAFWEGQVATIDRIDFRDIRPALPLARIKKIMKSDDDVKHMISADAPLLFSKACELFVHELTLRAWQFTEETHRRTLQRADISAAIQSSELFDFLLGFLSESSDDTQKPNVLVSTGTGLIPANPQPQSSNSSGKKRKVDEDRVEDMEALMRLYQRQVQAVKDAPTAMKKLQHHQQTHHTHHGHQSHSHSSQHNSNSNANSSNSAAAAAASSSLPPPSPNLGSANLQKRVKHE